MNRLQLIESLQLLGLVPLHPAALLDDSGTVTLARDEGRHEAFRIRVRVSERGEASLRINGVLSNDRDVVGAVRHFLKVVRPSW